MLENPNPERRSPVLNVRSFTWEMTRKGPLVPRVRAPPLPRPVPSSYLPYPHPLRALQRLHENTSSFSGISDPSDDRQAMGT